MESQIANTTQQVNKERIIGFLEKQHFMKLMKFRLDKIEYGLVEGRLDLEQIHTQQHGMVHGGVTATVADIVAGFAAYTMAEDYQNIVTVELKISYLNPGMGKQLHAIGTVLKRGSKLYFCESEVYSIEGDSTILIAKATATMAII
ncbi:PaaI family thioesterase [Peijinzhouia sedimentorum]